MGIAKANNQALALSTGEYILLVNADTISGKDSPEKMISFMDEHADTGGLGVRMLGPKGRFLPQSIHRLNKTVDCIPQICRVFKTFIKNPFI